MGIMTPEIRYNIYMKTVIICALAVCALNACKNSSSASVPVEEYVIEFVGGADVPDQHTSIFTAFKNLDGSAEAYIQASQLLDQLGAKPMSQGNDKAKQWYKLAVAMDASIAEKYPPFRGRVKGPAYREHKVTAGQIDVINEVFYAAEPAQLSIMTQQGSVTLSVKVKDADTPVCHIKVDTNMKSCAWTPIYTTPYEITLTNTSTTDVQYVLATN